MDTDDTGAERRVTKVVYNKELHPKLVPHFDLIAGIFPMVWIEEVPVILQELKEVEEPGYYEPVPIEPRKALSILQQYHPNVTRITEAWRTAHSTYLRGIDEKGREYSELFECL